MSRTRYAAAIAVVAAVAAIGVLASVASAGGVTQKLIQDPFSGSTIDSNVWAFWGGNDGSDVSMSEGHGALAFTIGAGAINDFTSGLTTRCAAHGDFDARLAFDLPQWTTNNGVWVSLNTAGTGGFNVYRVSWQFETGDSYSAFLPGTSGPPPVPADTGSSGTLRLTRNGNTWAGYYLDGDTWVLLDSGPGPTSDIQFSPGVFNISGVIPFGGNPTTVNFDRFQVNADSIVC
jgi:hypothetical protein